jgi:hypothetical protein
MDELNKVVDVPGIGAQQLIENIIGGLQVAYLQRNVPQIARVYIVYAETKNKFRVNEVLHVFSL